MHLATWGALFAHPADAHAQDNAEQRDLRLRSAAALDLGYTSFSGTTEAWQQASLSLFHRAAFGTAIARVNEARRFGESGLQVEAEAYPRLTASTYAYLDVGYSGSPVFPAWRSGVELFTALPRAWEVSGGYRQLRFTGAQVTLLTGSVGRYVGDYWFSLRPWVRTGTAATSASASVAARRYGADADHFVGLRAGLGSAPGDQLSPDQAARTTSASAAVHGSAGLGGALLGTWSLGVDRETLSPTQTRISETLLLGIKRGF